MFPDRNVKWLIKQCGTKIFSRGQWMNKKDHVLEVRAEGHGIVGKVLGSRGDRYETRASVNGNRLHTDCTCPYEWAPVCKHAVALILKFWDSPRHNRHHAAHAEVQQATKKVRVELYWDAPALRLSLKTPAAVRFCVVESGGYVSNLSDFLIREACEEGLARILTVLKRDGLVISEANGFFKLQPDQAALLFYLIQDSGLEVKWVDPKTKATAALEFSNTPVTGHLRVRPRHGQTLEFVWDNPSFNRPNTHPTLFGFGSNYFLLYAHTVRKLAYHPLLDELVLHQNHGRMTVPLARVATVLAALRDEENPAIRVRGLDGIKIPTIQAGDPVMNLTGDWRDGILMVAATFSYEGKVFDPQAIYRDEDTLAEVFSTPEGKWLRRNLGRERELIRELEKLTHREFATPFHTTEPEFFALSKQFSGDASQRITIKAPEGDASFSYAGELDWSFEVVESDGGWFDITPSFIAAQRKLAAGDVKRLLRGSDDPSGTLWKNGKTGAFAVPQGDIGNLASIFNADFESDEKGRYHLPSYQLFALYAVLKNSGKEKSLPPPILAKIEKDLKNLKVKNVALPKSFHGELRDYQRAGYGWLAALHDSGLSGILADDMGLGKTVQTLALLSRVRAATKKKLPNLIVAPTSVLLQWQSEAEKFTPHFKTIVYSGAGRKKLLAEAAKCDLVITSYAVVLRDAEIMKKTYGYCILDEAQMIKNAGTQRAKIIKAVKSAHRLVLTGTPIENRLSELWSLFDFILPGYLGHASHFKSRIENRIEKYDDAGAKELLHAKIRPFVLRRLKSEVEKELPPKTEEIVYCELLPEQKALYAEIVAKVRHDVFDAIDTKGIKRSHLEILAAMTRLRQVCCHPRLMWKGKKNQAPGSSKLDALVEIMETIRDDGHKALVFSQFVSMLDIVKEELDKREVPHRYLHGATRERDKEIKSFMTESAVPFFLVSLKAGGFGLNLTAADYVIHYDPWWNPAVENQATDRAHRIGQTRKVFVYKLIAKDTIEEKILKMQERKQKLSDDILKNEMSFVKNLSRETLEELLAVPAWN